MPKLRQTILSISMVTLFFVTPVVTNAQSTTENRIEMLQELIVLLQTQVELLLQAENEQSIYAEQDRPVFSDDSSFLEQMNADIVERYSVIDMNIETKRNRHLEYFERVKELIPDDYHDYFAEFVIFETGRDTVGAFVETEIPYNKQWRYAVNEEELRHPLNSRLTSELIVHEFGHIFPLHEVFISSQPNNCHEFFSRSGCVSPDIIYGKFLNEFWDDELLDEAVVVRDSSDPIDAADDLYDRYEDEFVSPYAASSPAEDFAESFTRFVLFNDQSYGNGANEKVSFFNRFSKTKEMKDEILDEL